MLGLPDDTPMITRDMVRRAKPDPDLFLAAAARLEVDPRDATWSATRLGSAGGPARRGLGVGLFRGYGQEELERAGASRVYADPADLLARADELGVRDLAR